MDDLNLEIFEDISSTEVMQVIERSTSKNGLRRGAHPQVEDRFAQLFENCPPSISESPNREMYVSFLVCGWSPQRVSDYAKEKCQEDISREPFRKLKALIQMAGSVQDSIQRRVWSPFEVDVTLDAFQEMMSVAMLQKSLVAEMLAHKDMIVGEYKSAGNLMTPVLVKQISDQNVVYFDMMTEVLKWQEKFGIVLTYQNGGKQQASLRKSLDELTPEEKKNFYEYLSSMRTKILERRKGLQIVQPTTHSTSEEVKPLNGHLGISQGE